MIYSNVLFCVGLGVIIVGSIFGTYNTLGPWSTVFLIGLWFIVIAWIFWAFQATIPGTRAREGGPGHE